ncbi:hypothetical protein MWU58_07940 [Flavobacteriaceae bacterium S0825]|uniref:hypothetical protein n=1 Tax=Gaetbulibacter sp. S0825 TaxID=2720084 RepID=UPI001FCBFC9C|nr:hypothetical protein [Gaetbulibacter sp. S0825]MCK0109220.1 hypothetical protein [Flavobacteriaceae bacterium S0825]
MKKLLLLTVLLSVLVSCGGRKQIEKQLHSGNYDVAITNALKKLENNKDKKRKEKFVVLLEDAYYKVVERDLKIIERLKKDGNPEHYKTIYEIYADLDARQEAIKPVLPLKIGNKYLNLEFNNYTDDLVDYRYKASDYLIDKGIDLLDSDDKYNAREAYSIFKYIERINPNFEEVRELLTEAHQKGIDYVIVNIENRTHQIIPHRLEQDLLDFDTYGLNQFWTVYHSVKNETIAYDYTMQLQLKQINISPEEIRERQLIRKKQIVDGWDYKLDEDGNVMKDSLGNDIKIDRIVNIRARLAEFSQFKSTQILADIVYTDLKSNQVLDAFPIDTEFVFENRYARFRGDKRALNNHDRTLVNQRQMHFPTDAQMVYDSGENLKQKLKRIINSYSLRG